MERGFRGLNTRITISVNPRLKIRGIRVQNIRKFFLYEKCKSKEIPILPDFKEYCFSILFDFAINFILLQKRCIRRIHRNERPFQTINVLSCISASHFFLFLFQ